MGQIVSFIAPTESGYSGWDYVKTSDPKEKIEIEKKIINNFPGGEIGFNNIMMQANLVAEKAFKDRATTQPFAAVQNLKNKITQWVK